MENYKYKVSVIVPVYNVENYLRDCLDSLLAQTIDHNQMEVLLINDGSTDSSLDICYEYAQSHFIFKVFTQENAGVSAARNRGIMEAQGKYIFYLDGDDTISYNCIDSVTDFFDKHYEEIDIVTMKMVSFINDVPQKLHFRYNYLKESGVYDVQNIPYIVQSSMNVCVKNTEDKFYFNEDIAYHEDEMYNNKIISQKMKIGFVSNCQYNYIKREESVTGTNTNAMFLFENNMTYWENIFDQYKEEIPVYFQAMFFHDTSWKFQENKLYPYHYSEENFKIAKDRIHNLLDKVDINIIMSYPRIDNYQKLYWIREKSFKKTSIYFNRNSMCIMNDEKILYQRKDVELIIKRTVVDDNKLKLVGFFKSPFFSFINDNDFELVVSENGIERKLPKIISGASYFKAKERTEKFYQIVNTFDIGDGLDLRFFVELDGIRYETVFWNGDYSIFSKSKEVKIKNNIFKQNGNKISVEVSKAEAGYSDIKIKKDDSIDCRNEKNIINRNLDIKEKNVWLYYDNNVCERDNAYYQFINDLKYDDGIERYYIIYPDYEYDYSNIINNIVRFKSDKHKTLFLRCSKLLTSFAEYENICPFSNIKNNEICDRLSFNVIYLQHGILHAHMPWYYNPVNLNIDKIVVSSNFEIQNLHNIYGFNNEDIIPTGMNRYDRLNKNTHNASRKIIFAPSWRSYLIGKLDKSGNRQASGAFSDSNYFINIFKFINDPHLHKLLEKNDFTLEVKLHPNFAKAYNENLRFESPRVILSENNINLSDYALFITDFSSFVFDYAYLRRPIIYFVPDYNEFISGMNHYKKLDLPFEEAFGNLVTEPNDAVNEIERIIENDFKPDSIFKERMENFFLPMDNCAENLYKYLIGEE